MIAVIYARKSTEQVGFDDDAKSVARQVEHARAFAVAHGWTVLDEHVYADDGVSGAIFGDGRPGLMRLLNALPPEDGRQADGRAGAAGCQARAVRPAAVYLRGVLRGARRRQRAAPGGVYVCSARRRKGTAVCDSDVHLPIAETEGAILDAVERDLLDPALFDDVLDLAVSRLSRHTDTAGLEAERDRLAREIANLVAALPRGATCPRSWRSCEAGKTARGRSTVDCPR